MRGNKSSTKLQSHAVVFRRVCIVHKTVGGGINPLVLMHGRRVARPCRCCTTTKSNENHSARQRHNKPAPSAHGTHRTSLDTDKTATTTTTTTTSGNRTDPPQHLVNLAIYFPVQDERHEQVLHVGHGYAVQLRRKVPQSHPRVRGYCLEQDLSRNTYVRDVLVVFFARSDDPGGDRVGGVGGFTPMNLSQQDSFRVWCRRRLWVVVFDTACWVLVSAVEMSRL